VQTNLGDRQLTSSGPPSVAAVRVAEAGKTRRRPRLTPYRPSEPNVLREGSLAGFVWRATGWHQVILALLAIFIAVLQFTPVDLQRRIADGAILQNDLHMLLGLGAIYGAVVLLSSALKYVLSVYQAWLGESAIKASREELAVAAEHRSRVAALGGQVVHVIGAETEPLGGFVGESISQALANATLLAVTVGYMIVIEPLIALCSCLLLAPQVLVAPYLQAKLNRLVERQLQLIRQLGDQITRSDGTADCEPEQRLSTISTIYRNRIRFYLLKFALKALLNLANAMGPLMVLIIGGWMAIRGQTTVGTVVAFVSGLERLSTPLRDLINFYRAAAQAKVQHAMITNWVAGGRQSREEGPKPPRAGQNQNVARLLAPESGLPPVRGWASQADGPHAASRSLRLAGLEVSPEATGVTPADDRRQTSCA
jgi:ABC-type bacteriocin/lantibiotic exporter with double-glycine peptidase domain